MQSCKVAKLHLTQRKWRIEDCFYRVYEESDIKSALNITKPSDTQANLVKTEIILSQVTFHVLK